MRNRSIGIALRTTLLSWSVTLATLLIFVAVIVPWQRHVLLLSLESKAQSVAVSLHEVAASAAVNEDYSSVVDHCKELLDGDSSLAYLVITKNDGFSLIQNRNGWRAESHIGSEWRPQRREPSSGIEFVPLFGMKAFQYSQPFDYSGIQWGWIHVGLTLEKYDHSLASLYIITFLAAILCGALSFVASRAYAGRFVRPILDLKATVKRVADGELSARAAADRSDELGSLASSVNLMTEALLRRDQILASVQFAAQRFLGAPNWADAIDDVLSRIGQAAEVGRAYVVENEAGEGGRLMMRRRREWTALSAGADGGAAVPERLDYAQSGYRRWRERLGRREMIASKESEMEEPERSWFSAAGTRSVLTIPIVVDDVWWGFLGFDDCLQERQWSGAERDSLRAAADMLGAAIARQRAQDALLDAKANLERRVLERTEALRRENFDRKEAEFALARSLSLINATLESTLDGIVVLGPAFQVRHFNRRFADMWNVDAGSLKAQGSENILNLMAAQLRDPERFIGSSTDLHRDLVAESFDVVEFKDGRIIERFTRPHRSDGVSDGRVWCYRDITERKQAEAEITYERDLLQTLMDSLPDVLYFKDLKGRFVRVSRSMVEGVLAILRERHDAGRPAASRGDGYPPHLRSMEAMRAWLVGKTDLDTFMSDSAQELFDEEQAIIRTARPVMGKIESIAMPNGSTQWHLVTKMPWRDRRGTIVGTYGVSKDITAIKEAEGKLAAVHDQLMQASRQAGMAEVATGVLHNVGNVLNSVNVSATLVRDTLLSSEVNTLSRVARLMKARREDLGAFLTSDPKGMVIPGLVMQLSDQLSREHDLLKTEHEHLARNVEHIKEIVAMQQNYARSSGVLEKCSLTELLAEAIQIHANALKRHKISVVRDYDEVPTAIIDKHKVMQILVNLIQNAKHALEESGPENRRVTMGISMAGANRVRVSVVDNGVGIPPENITRIFSRGFTTRKNGHGFGLHSGAIAAREMGGILIGESAGVGKGATFTLELPIDGDVRNHE